MIGKQIKSKNRSIVLLADGSGIVGIRFAIMQELPRPRARCECRHGADFTTITLSDWGKRALLQLLHEDSRNQTWGKGNYDPKCIPQKEIENGPAL